MFGLASACLGGSFRFHFIVRHFNCIAVGSSEINILILPGNQISPSVDVPVFESQPLFSD
jgi:hypothetical protein